jgi:predicted signal transduction protein with EAL and GGDEF domain
LRKPIDTDEGPVHVGASIGVIIIVPLSRVVSIDRLHAQADKEMFRAKRAGGGVRMHRPDVLDHVS